MWQRPALLPCRLPSPVLHQYSSDITNEFQRCDYAYSDTTFNLDYLSRRNLDFINVECLLQLDEIVQQPEWPESLIFAWHFQGTHMYLPVCEHLLRKGHNITSV